MKLDIMGKDNQNQLTISDFLDMYSNKWRINTVCKNCGEIISNPLKNFIDCFLGDGIVGDEELTKVCEEFQKTEQKLWELIDKHKFEFIEDE